MFIIWCMCLLFSVVVFMCDFCGWWMVNGSAMFGASAVFQLCSVICCEVGVAFQLLYYGYLMCHSYLGWLYWFNN